MKKNYNLKTLTCGSIAMISVILLLSSCISMAPVNSTFESAKTLSKGQFELQGHYSKYTYREKSEEAGIATTNEASNANVGVRVGYGISDRLDLKLRYERLKPLLQEDKDQVDRINYFSLTPRYNILKDYISGGVELGLYKTTVKDAESGDYSESAFVISPRLAFTYPSTPYFDLTLTSKLDIFTEGSGNYLGLNLGCGLSSDMNVWSLRPEAGLMFSLDDIGYGVVWKTIGVALILKINPTKPVGM